MIYATVGTQLPFDRMVHAVDGWAARRERDDVLAQIGPSDRPPRHIRHVPFTSSAECLGHITRAEAVVAHAGMGSIITALQLGRPILVVPRRAELGEHRNDHQLATVGHVADLPGVAVCHDEAELPERLDRLLAEAPPASVIRDRAEQRLLDCLERFVTDGDEADVPASEETPRGPGWLASIVRGLPRRA